MKGEAKPVAQTTLPWSLGSVLMNLFALTEMITFNVCLLIVHSLKIHIILRKIFRNKVK